MPTEPIPDLDQKVKILNEYLRNDGTEKILDPVLLQDIINTRFHNGKIDPTTITPRIRAFMNALLASHLIPPVFSPEHQSEYISLLQKDLYFEQQTIDTPEEFDRIYAAYKASNSILFRGQSEAKWRLYNKLQRFWIGQRLFENADNYQTLLEKLVDNGKRLHVDQIHELLDENNIDINNDIAVLGYLQHHGCPTPLMDWTFRFGNALYFALDGMAPNSGTKEIEDYLSVYYLEEEHFESGGERTSINAILPEANEKELHKIIEIITDDPAKQDEMKEYFKGREILDRKLFNGSGLISHMLEMKRMINIPLTYFSEKDADSGIIFSLNNSENILHQEGVFTWTSDPSKPIEMVGEEEFHKANPGSHQNEYRFCNCFNINKNLRDHILSELEKDGITKDYIYPNAARETWDVFEESKRV